MQDTRSPWDNGPQGVIVDTECHMFNGLPGITIVGYANRAVDEAKERIRNAFASSKPTLPRKRIIINLAPADLAKEVEGFIGEVGLDGSVRPVRGVNGKILAAKRHDITTIMLPQGNVAQASLIPGITLLPIQNLRTLYEQYSQQSVSDLFIQAPVVLHVQQQKQNIQTILAMLLDKPEQSNSVEPAHISEALRYNSHKYHAAD